jgi:hypothetical protein
MCSRHHAVELCIKLENYIFTKNTCVNRIFSIFNLYSGSKNDKAVEASFIEREKEKKVWIYLYYFFCAEKVSNGS